MFSCNCALLHGPHIGATNIFQSSEVGPQAMLEPKGSKARNFRHTKECDKSPRRWKCSFLILEDRYIIGNYVAMVNMVDFSFGPMAMGALWVLIFKYLAREISGHASTAKAKWFIDTLPLPKPFLKEHSNHRY